MSIFELFAQTYPRLLQGLWMTIELTLVSLLIAAASLWFVICFKDYFFTGNFTCIH